eukprot:scaffold7107_cov205-Skeletonema_marinoi.AAC.1
MLAAIPNWTSSGHLRRCSNAVKCTKSVRSGIYNESLEAVDCHTHSARYDMVLCNACGHPKLDLIRSPTTL